jgi:hypothetical protein
MKVPPFERVQPSVDRRSTIKTDDSDFPSMMPSAPIRTITPDVSAPRTSSKGRPDNQ